MDFAAPMARDYSCVEFSGRSTNSSVNVMWRRVIQLSSSPRQLLSSVLALDDAPHAIALGVAIGIFVGLTPTVGIQTGLILGIVFITRRFFYFNASAAMAATYVSNPFTMLPMYYFWYHLGTWFVPGNMTFVELRAALQFDGIGGWWSSMCAVGIEVGGPMFIGALLTAPIGVLIAYPVSYFVVKWARRPSTSGCNESQDRLDTAHRQSTHSDSGTALHPSVTKRVQNL